MMIFSPTLHELGLRGMPRRTMISQVSYMQPEWQALLPLVGIGGFLLFASAGLYFLNVALTMVASDRTPQPAVEFAETLSGADQAPVFLDRWRPWLALAAILIAVAYGPTLVRLAITTPLTTPGFRVW
jgi:cytochrome c oxidase subunit 1